MYYSNLVRYNYSPDDKKQVEVVSCCKRQDAIKGRQKQTSSPEIAARSLVIILSDAILITSLHLVALISCVRRPPLPFQITTSINISSYGMVNNHQIMQL